jgi:hypothetical protein
MAVAGFAVWNAVAPPKELLPGVPSGWTRLAVISGSSSQSQDVMLHQVQLRICWVARGSQITDLAYQIGSPVAGPTVMYNPSTENNESHGCAFDPGNDNGSESFSVIESGIGSYAVSLDEELSPSQERALRQEARQQAQDQARAAAEQAVNSAAVTVSSDLPGVSNDTANLKTDLSSLSSSLQEEQTDLTTTQQTSSSVQSQVQQDGVNDTLCGTPIPTKVMLTPFRAMQIRYRATSTRSRLT